MPQPLVSIGMPVYNGERTVCAAIDSVLSQSWKDWELVISDNASTDRTAEICMAYAAGEPRIRYLRQPMNLGAPRNFRKVLDESRGELFMWAAADDRRSPDFIEANARFLFDHPEYVASCSPVKLDGAAGLARYMGDESIVGSRAQRMLAAIPAHANGRFYSVYRRSVLVECSFIDQWFLGADWAIVLHVAAQGPMHRIDRGWTVLGVGGASRSGDLYRASRRSWLDLWLPFGTFSKYAWSQRNGFTAAQKLLLAGKLAHLNGFGFVAQCAEAVRAVRRARGH